LRKALVGRFGYAVRFDGDDLEVVADGHGQPDADVLDADGSVEAIRKLPSGTVGAVAIANGDQLVDRTWERLKNLAEGAGGVLVPLAGIGAGDLDEAVRDFETETGLKIPADIGVLFGRDFVAAVDGEGLPDSPRVGVRAKTDGARAEEVLRKLVDAADGASDVTIKRTLDGYVAASEQSYADALAGDGTLGDEDAFKAALPDAEKADFAAFVDIERLVALTRDNASTGDRMSADERANLEPLDALGVTAASNGDGEFRMRIKLVTK
jgi:hypothetical protein